MGGETARGRSSDDGALASRDQDANPHPTGRKRNEPAPGVESAPGGVRIRSPVSWGLLGLIIERPSYGYELYKRFERTYGRHLRISSESHIYRSLDTLESREFIEVVPASGRPARQPRPYYRATEKGKLGYRDWLEAMAREQLFPSALFVCALTALAHEPRVALLVIECCEWASSPRRMAEHHDFGGLDDPHGRNPGLAGRLLAEERRLATQAAVPWIAYARREFEELAASLDRHHHRQPQPPTGS